MRPAATTRRRFPGPVAALAPILVLLACSPGHADADPGDRVIRLRIGGSDRSYVVHRPAGHDSGKRVPAVIMFHGGGGTARAADRQTGWSAKADREGFLAVFPEGSRPTPSAPTRFGRNPQTWNDGSDRRQIGAVRRRADDVAFVRALIGDLAARFDVDRRRVFATGFSNGASMVFRLGRELPGYFPAIAPVAGSDWMDRPAVGGSLSLLYITGTADPLNPIAGGEIRIGRKRFGTKPPVRGFVRNWARMLACPPRPRISRGVDGVEGAAYRPCRDRSEVVMYSIRGMGHAWPGGRGFLPERIVGKSSDRMNATDVIWDFFRRHFGK